MFSPKIGENCDNNIDPRPPTMHFASLKKREAFETGKNLSKKLPG
jgi:hypothetical protein